MSRVIEKIALCLCEQQRRRSAIILRLISAFVVCYFDSIMSLGCIYEVSVFWILNITEQTGMRRTWPENHDRLFRDGLK